MEILRLMTLTSTPINIASKNQPQKIAQTGDCSFVNQTKKFIKQFISFVKFFEVLEFSNGLWLFFFSVFAVSFIFLAATIFILSFIKEIRSTVHGKSMIFLLVIVLITYISFPLSYHEWIEVATELTEITVLSGLLSSVCWTNVLLFDIWWMVR